MSELNYAAECREPDPEEARERFEDALAAFVLACATIQEDYLVRNFPHVALSTFEIESGPKYTRLVQVGANNGGRSVHAFVRNQDGAILYPAGWRGPQLKGKTPVRGSIYAVDHGASCMGPHGVRSQR